MTKALVLFSGGQDSTTCLYWALQNFDDVVALGFDYGQKHRVELEQAAKIAEMAGVPFEVLKMDGLVGNSALTNPGMDINASHPQAVGLPGAFVPGRNLIFLSLASSYAFNQGIFDIVGGMCQTDYSGYPDCRRVFIESFETSVSLATMQDFRVHTPLMYLNKADTFKLAEDLGILEIILEHTHTDYNGDRSERHPWGYGKLDNEASRLRARGWEEYRSRYHTGSATSDDLPESHELSTGTDLPTMGGPATVEMMAFDADSLAAAAAAMSSPPAMELPGAATDEHEAVPDPDKEKGE
ncbi:MAG: 7-cyano-7-deazaguanine synthase QueC [Myxococcales bacterium]|nr:7-cyano-7-deazaguanine synthase QueC [Myxococcales bacterium]